MLLGILGDNTYSNYAEANRAFYRQTVVPLVTRLASALGNWLGESFGGNLRLAPAFPIAEAEDMPNMAEDSYSIAFGDFRRGYLVIDRQGVRVLRDPYSSKPYVLFYVTKRVGGGVQDFDAIKLLKFSAA